MEARRINKAPNRSQQHQRIPATKELISRGRCTRCGNEDHEPAKCPHQAAVCHGCKLSGHLKRVCQKTRLGKSNQSKVAADAVTEESVPYCADEGTPYTSDDEDVKDNTRVKKVIIKQVSGNWDVARINCGSMMPLILLLVRTLGLQERSSAMI